MIAILDFLLNPIELDSGVFDLYEALLREAFDENQRIDSGKSTFDRLGVC